MSPLQSLLAHQPFLKVIAGIHNLDVASVRQIAQAANQAHAHALDVAADPAIVSMARAEFTGILFASSVSPQALAEAVQYGADVVELGNFDALYKAGAFLTASQVYELTEQTVQAVKAINPQAGICVTIPGHLDATSQERLAHDCQLLGVDLLQTEGAVRLLNMTPAVKPLTPNEQLALTLNNTRTLVATQTLPVMTATALTPQTVHKAIQAGACGVGVGQAIRAQQTQKDMVLTIQSLLDELRPQASVLSA
ncbi:MAG: DUF561 domain-containing protein [Vampirovibrionales bacterium]